jgi:hypothetical protein
VFYKKISSLQINPIKINHAESATLQRASASAKSDNLSFSKSYPTEGIHPRREQASAIF